MGREKKILLGFLGLLAGVFVGVLSAKLLVPRPPAGTGPDIRSDAALATAHERVEPPSPSPPAATGAWNFAAAPPLAPDPPADRATADDASAAPPEEPSRFSRFAAAAPVEPPSAADEGVTPVAWQRADAPTPPPIETADLAAPPPMPTRPAVPDRPARDPFAAPPAAPRAPVAGAYLVQAGDSWWGVAERAYGDGRLYRALFAWNRSHDPRVSLAPGTRLDVPPLDRLQAAWPRLAAPR